MRRILRATVMVAVLAACSQSEVEVLAPKFTPSAISLGLNASQPVRISEFHYDNVGGDNNEWIEVSGPGGTNLSGYSIVLYDGANGMAYNTKPLGGTIPAICSGRGVSLFMYPLNFIQNGSPDGLALIGPGPTVIEFLSYEGSFTAVDGPAAGMTSTDIGVFEDGNGPNSPVTSLWRFGASTVWAGPSQNSFGTCNDQTEPPPADQVVVTPASATLIIGAMQQLTAQAFDATNKLIPNQSFFWTSSTASVATVTPLGLVQAVSPGDVLIIASAPNGKADTSFVHVEYPPVASVEVTPPSATLVEGATQQLSAVAFDAAHQPIPNQAIAWASSVASVAAVTPLGLVTAVSPGDAQIIASTPNGKADTSVVHVDPPPVASVEVTPSSATLLEGATQQLAAVAYDATHKAIANTPISWTSTAAAIATVSAQGLVTAVKAGDVLVIGAAPNGKADTAFVHVNPLNRAPTAALNGPFTGSEGTTPVNMSGAASSDPDAGDVLTYAWTFGDGSSGTGVNVSHAYPQDGAYSVKLTVTDSKGLTSSVTATATISNVAPSIDPFAGATLLPGETYTASGSFTDPGADTWSATVDFGDGSGVVPLSLSGKNFSINHVCAYAGTYTVTIRVSDDDVTSTITSTVTVLSQGDGVNDALALLAQLVAQGKIETSYSNPIREALQNAASKITDGKMDLAASELDNAVRNMDNAVRVGKASADDLQELRALILRIQASVAPGFVSTQKNRKK